MPRPQGAKNKVPGIAKENISAVFVRMGGTAAMASWAKENPTEFYKLYARLIPTEVSGVGGGPLKVEVVKFADSPPSG